MAMAVRAEPAARQRAAVRPSTAARAGGVTCRNSPRLAPADAAAGRAAAFRGAGMKTKTQHVPTRPQRQGDDEEQRRGQPEHPGPKLRNAHAGQLRQQIVNHKQLTKGGKSCSEAKASEIGVPVKTRSRARRM